MPEDIKFWYGHAYVFLNENVVIISGGIRFFYDG